MKPPDFSSPVWATVPRPQAFRVHLRAEPPLRGAEAGPQASSPASFKAPQRLPGVLLFHKLSATLSSRFLITLDIYRTQKTRLNKYALSEVIFSERKQCSLMSHFKRKNYFHNRNKYCNHLLFVQPSNCFDNKKQAGALPVCPEGCCLLGRQLPPTFPHPLLLSKGISGPAVREPGNSTFSVQPASECSFDIKSLYCAKENHILVKIFRLEN